MNDQKLDYRIEVERCKITAHMQFEDFEQSLRFMYALRDFIARESGKAPPQNMG